MAPVNRVEAVADDPRYLEGKPASEFHAFLDEVFAGLAESNGTSLARVPSDRPVQVIADSHGDYVSVGRALRYARSRDPPHRFVGLGDYIDRATCRDPEPTALPGGSIWNLAFLLAWATRAPDEVLLLRGNHEAPRRFPVPVMTFLRELRQHFPREEAFGLYCRCLDACDRLPAAAATENGVFLAHGGIPPGSASARLGSRPIDDRVLEGLLWSDPAEEYEDRGIGFSYTAKDLERFLGRNRWRVMVKGHAPAHLGRSMYGRQLLTIHTSDLFQDLGHRGILMAEIPAIRRVRSTRDLTVRQLVRGDWKPYRVAEDPAGPRRRSVPARGRKGRPGVPIPAVMRRDGAGPPHRHTLMPRKFGPDGLDP